jgi:glycosyltransferase involved in cell wall biosynthesis
MELVSVVIPTFNSAKFIGTAINSIVAQNHPLTEIIVVDDGSTDDTLAVARRILEATVVAHQVIQLPANRGPSAARNVGLRASQGSWIQFLDSDDILMPRKFERQLAAAASAAARDVAAFYSPYRWGFLENGKIEWAGPLMTSFIEGKPPILCLAGGVRPLLCACLVRREALIEAGGLDETLRFWECEEACVRLAKVGRFLPAHSDEPLYLWRLERGSLYIGAGGCSRYQSANVALAWINVALKASDNRVIDSLDLSATDERMLMNECTLWGRVVYVDDRAAFREYLKLARKFNPRLAPTYPFYIEALSRWTDYETAEAVARIIRQPKVWLRSTLVALGLRTPNHLIELR